jgi:hypothetical protein
MEKLDPLYPGTRNGLQIGGNALGGHVSADEVEPGFGLKHLSWSLKSGGILMAEIALQSFGLRKHWWRCALGEIRQQRRQNNKQKDSPELHAGDWPGKVCGFTAANGRVQHWRVKGNAQFHTDVLRPSVGANPEGFKVG